MKRSSKFLTLEIRRLRVVEANVLNRDILVSEFELQSCYYIHFRTNIHGKGMNLLFPLSYGLNSSTTVILQGWIWHKITHKGWYAIKLRKQTKCFLR